MNLRQKMTSPIIAMCTAYAYLAVIGISLWATGFYKGNNYFNWGPPIKLFSHDITTQRKFYAVHIMIFFHQLVNNWVNTVVYPWIINDIQDPKSKEMRYGMTPSLLLINFFDLYSEFDVMLILMGFTSQISFIMTVTIANIITSTIINRRYILDKTTGVHSPLLRIDASLNMV